MTALLPLRAFLGVTFVYAGVQKLSDPGFLHPGAPTYIGSQLRSFAQGTPGGFLLRAFALPHPALAGVGVALLEIAIGLLVLVGLRTRAASVAGLCLSLVLFLTASWKTHPYFLGSDIVFVFAWTPLAIAGAEGQPALDNLEVGRASGAAGTRRDLLAQALGVVGLATLAIAGLSALLRGTYRGRPTARLGARRVHPAAGGHKSHAAPAAPPSAPAGGVRLGTSRRLRRGQAAIYADPSDGRPDVIIRFADGALSAHSAVCTHAGCQVQFQDGNLYCPCHASVFDARTGRVLQGPAVEPLPARKVEERGGVIYATPA